MTQPPLECFKGRGTARGGGDKDKAEYNYAEHTAMTYVYDANGNIVSKTPYTNVTSSDLSTATQGTAIVYGYGDSNWSDKLTSYDGQTITYDASGNPTSYRGETVTWNGRLMTSFTKDDRRYEYSYNSDGMRTVKKVYKNNELVYTYTYIWDGDVLLAGRMEVADADEPITIRYLYDDSGELYGMDYNGNGYYGFIKNLQGDIVSIVPLDSESNVELNIEYDAWGKPIFEESSLGAAFVKAMIMAAVNVGYRGYFYDFETGLYYLRSRYYDPEIGRFINADDTAYLGYDGTPLSLNLFAYCENNPVNDSDFTGYYSSKKAIEYAKRWWNGKNPEYKYNNGGDCANFVSQCLYAGGYARMSGVGKKGWHHYVVYSYPIYNKWGAIVKIVPCCWQISDAWGKVNPLRNWISGNTLTFVNKRSYTDKDYKKFIKKLSSYANGKSVICFMRNDKTEYHHIVISGDYKNGNLYYYGHTNSKKGDGSDYTASLIYALKRRVTRDDIKKNNFNSKYLNDIFYKRIQVMIL